MRGRLRPCGHGLDGVLRLEPPVNHVAELDLAKPSAAAALQHAGITVLSSEQPVFRVRVIEVDESLVRSDVWIGEDHLRSRADLFIVGEEALFDELGRLGVGRDDLEHHYTVDYPI